MDSSMDYNAHMHVILLTTERNTKYKIQKSKQKSGRHYITINH